MSKVTQNIDVLISRIPEGFEQTCYETKALERRRGVKSPLDLLRLVLMYLVNDYSLLEISITASLLKIGNLSHTAFMNRFAKCKDWLACMVSQILPEPIIEYGAPNVLKGYAIAAVDASEVSEKGRVGKLFRLHYMMNILTMSAISHRITDVKTGESLTNFDLKSAVESVGGKLLVIADRAYGTLKSITYCLESGADFAFRLKYNSFTVYDDKGVKMDLLHEIHKLNTECENAVELPMFIKNACGELQKIRVCAVRIPDDKVYETEHRGYRKGKGYRKRDKTSDEASEMRRYVVLATSLPDCVSANEVIKVYRLRWQIELYFKRLKSIMDFGNVPLRRSDSIMTWLNGKLLISLLTERLIAEVAFSPGNVGSAQYLA